MPNMLPPMTVSLTCPTQQSNSCSVEAAWMTLLAAVTQFQTPPLHHVHQNMLERGTFLLQQRIPQYKYMFALTIGVTNDMNSLNHHPGSMPTDQGKDVYSLTLVELARKFGHTLNPDRAELTSKRRPAWHLSWRRHRQLNLSIQPGSPYPPGRDWPGWVVRQKQRRRLGAGLKALIGQSLYKRKQQSNISSSPCISLNSASLTFHNYLGIQMPSQFPLFCYPTHLHTYS